MTVEVSTDDHTELILATQNTLKETIAVIHPGITLGEIGQRTNEVATAHGFNVIRNLSGHTIDQYTVHAGISIPAINTEDIINLNRKMIINQSNLGTLAAKIKDDKDLKNENIVKVITKKDINENQFSEAKTFLRYSSKIDNIYNHIGIYCYSTETLEKFVHLSQSKNEIENKLEQLRALDNNIMINVSLAKSSPIGVDTKEDYLALKKNMEYKIK